MIFNMNFSALLSALLVASSIELGQALPTETKVITSGLRKIQSKRGLLSHADYQLESARSNLRLAKALGSLVQRRDGGGYDPAGVTASQNNTLTEPTEQPTSHGTDALGIVSNDIGYTAVVQIGTPPQDFQLLVDTGSSDFFVAAEDCKADDGTECSKNHKVLSSQKSSTFKDTNQPWSVQYGSGAVSGTIVSDTVKLAGMTINNMVMGVANNETAEFAGDKVTYDGILGMGQAGLSDQNTGSFLSALKNASQIKDRVAGFLIPRLDDGNKDGQVTFGGVDSSKFDPSTTVSLDNIGDQGYWQAKMDSVSVNGKLVEIEHKSRTAIMDTGTSLLVIPPEDADAIHKNIEGARYDNSSASWIVPCTTSANFSMAFGGKDFPIDPRDLLFAPLDAKNLAGECWSGINSATVGGQYVWLVGDVFLKNIYLAIDEDKNKISISRLV